MLITVVLEVRDGSWATGVCRSRKQPEKSQGLPLRLREGGGHPPEGCRPDNRGLFGK